MIIFYYKISWFCSVVCTYIYDDDEDYTAARVCEWVVSFGLVSFSWYFLSSTFFWWTFFVFANLFEFHRCCCYCCCFCGLIEIPHANKHKMYIWIKTTTTQHCVFGFADDHFLSSLLLLLFCCRFWYVIACTCYGHVLLFFHCKLS